jgi:hypothetical protein
MSNCNEYAYNASTASYTARPFVSTRTPYDELLMKQWKATFDDQSAPMFSALRENFNVPNKPVWKQTNARKGKRTVERYSNYQASFHDTYNPSSY